MLKRKKAGRKKKSAALPEVWYADDDSDSGTRELENRCGGIEAGYAAYAACEEIEIGTASVQGTRQSQQDTVFASQSAGQALAIICDGMGGLAGGETASRVAAECIADAWFSRPNLSDVPDFFRRVAVSADEKVFLQTDSSGNPLRAGTTVAAVILLGSRLYWLSVGDSRIYMLRGNELLALNEEHNYRMILNNRLKRGELTPEQYAAEEYRAEALISYLGMGNVSLMDINAQAYPLSDGDIVLLSSDGLYRSLYEEEILAIVKKHERDMQETAYALMAAVEGRKKQDNTSVALLRYRCVR